MRNGNGNFTKFYYKFHNVRMTKKAMYFYMPPGARVSKHSVRLWQWRGRVCCRRVTRMVLMPGAGLKSLLAAAAAWLLPDPAR